MPGCLPRPDRRCARAPARSGGGWWCGPRPDPRRAALQSTWAKCMRKFLERLFGGSCFLCRGAATDLLCPSCDADLPRLAAPCCPRCALPSPRGELCGRCLNEAPHYDATIAALAYEFPADVLVHALKFRGELAIAGLLGGLLSNQINTV